MSSSFRDLAALPFVGKASEAKILRACVVVYSLALCVFIGTTIAYSSMESLKQERVVTSVEPITGMDCKMLAPVRLTVDTGLAATTFLTSNGNGGTCDGITFPAPSPSSLIIVYNGYFESLDECQRHVNLQITSVSAGTSGIGGGAVFESVTGAGSKISLSFPGGLNGCSFTTQTLYSFLETHLPSMNQRLCEPWERNPPFQCTQLETLSPLSITSQSLAIATSSLALFVFLANRLLLTYGGDSYIAETKLNVVTPSAPSPSHTNDESAAKAEAETETETETWKDKDEETEIMWKDKETGALVQKSLHDDL